MADIAKSAVRKIQRILSEQKVTQGEVAAELGVSQSVVSKWMNNANSPNREATDKINRYYARFWPEETDGRYVDPNETIPYVNLDISDAIEISDKGKVQVGEDAEEGFWAFPVPLRRRLGLPQNIISATVTTDAMVPTIAAGSVIFMDIAGANAENGVYAIRTARGSMIRRLQFDIAGENIELSADNKQVYPDVSTIEADKLQIIGRVVGTLSMTV